MKTKIINKAISAILIFILTFSYWGVLVEKVYAEYEELEKQKVQTNHKSVEFDTYFKENNENVHMATYSKDQVGKLYANLSTKEGYLKQISVKLDNPNFSIQTEDIQQHEEKDENVEEASVNNETEEQSNENESNNELEKTQAPEIFEDKDIDIADNEITIDIVENQKEIELPVIFKKQELIDADYFSKETKISLKAILVDNKGKEKEIEAERKIVVEWTQEVNIEVEQQVEKVINLGENRYLLQTNLKTRIQDNSIPAENTSIEILNPVIDNIAIEKVDMYAINTTMSNGITDNLGFTNENWQYNTEEGKILVNIENKRNSENKIVWKEGENEFKLIYILSSEEEIEGKDIKLGVTGKIIYNGREVSFEDTKDSKIEISGKLIDIEFLMTEDVNKGYMYARTQDTEYVTRIGAEVSYSELIDYIDINMQKDGFVNSTENKLNTDSNIFKRTVINKTNFITLFGEEGRIDIYANGDKIAEITKDTETNEEGNFVINYPENITEVRVVTSKPIAEGKLGIANLKAIKSETEYSREEIMDLTGIESEVAVTTNMTNETKQSRMNLLETVTKAEVEMLTEKISTVIKNEAVEIKVLLRTDSNAYDLYKNPYLEIELPIEVKEAEIESIAAAFGDGFTINWYDVVETETGNKVLRISLNGEQTRYAIDMSEGMTIVITTKMTLDRKSGSKEDVIKLRYRNENAIGYDNNGETEGRIEIEAPKGVVAINSMSNYNAEGQTATSLSSKEQIGDLEIFTDRKTAKVTIDVVNNYDTEIENPTILGRFPTEGNKKENGEDLGSTFTPGLVREIQKVEGLENTDYKIYYSSNVEATNDLNKAENGWNENIYDVGEAKSYLIQVSGYNMEQGESMSFDYEIEIPERLNHNESAYSTYAVEYSIEEDGTTRNETTIAPTVGATTGPGPVLEANLQADVQNGANVEEGQKITYTVSLKNAGSETIRNIKINTIVPNNMEFDSCEPKKDADYKIEYEYELDPDADGTAGEGIHNRFFIKDSLEVGETYETKLVLMVGTLDNKNEEKNEINIAPTITYDNLEKEIIVGEYKNKMIEGHPTIKMQSEYDNSIITSGKEITVDAIARNDTSKDRENIVVKYKVPESFDYISTSNSGSGDVNYDEKTRIVTVNVGNMKKYRQNKITFKMKVKEFQENVYEQEVITNASIQVNGMAGERTSNDIIIKLARPKIVVNQSSNRDYVMNAGDEIQYYIEVVNEGNYYAKDVKLVDILPQELIYSSLDCEINNERETLATYVNNDNHYEVKFDIPANDKVMLTLTARAKQLENKEVEITNSGHILNDKQQVSLNSLTHKIISEGSEGGNNGDNNNEDGNGGTITTPDGNRVNVYNISGLAWEDTNEDGQKSAGEPSISGIEVILIDNNRGSIATKASNGETQRTTVDSNGTYRFTEVQQGNYTIVFLYNNSEYTVTQYKKSGVLETENSDAMKTQIVIDGKNTTAGVTEAFEVNRSSISGMNIGLIRMNSAQLSINKVVTKMTMTNPKTSKTATFNNSKLAKMDADWKYMNSTNFVIQYKLQVTNEGSVPAYAKKIVDKIPNSFRFSPDTNKNWYSGKNGEIYTTSLANTVINPGETKEVTLVLTKAMNETGDGIFHNTAEIAEVYNEYGLGNKIVKDTTKQGADVMIAVKTGRGPLYITLIFVIIGFLGTGVYFISKKVAQKDADKIAKIDNIEL